MPTQVLVAHKVYWYFDDPIVAKQFADISLYLTEHIFATPWDQLMYYWAAAALRQALDIQLLVLNDIHFSVDDQIWYKLTMSTDQTIQDLLYKIMHYQEQYYLGDEHDFDIFITAKFRGVDPLVQTCDGMQRLTEVDSEFCQEFERIKNQVTKGWYVKFVS